MTDFPRFFRVRQSFPSDQLSDVPTRTTEQVHRAVAGRSLVGKSVAVAVGSRGIAGLSTIAKQTIRTLQQLGAQPFIVPAMGSHGGGTADGQTAVLERFGITPDSMGCPIESSMEVTHISDASQGFPVYIDTLAAKADFVFLINRIKPHTRFAGEIESGLMKMLLIGLGKRTGAEIYHRVIVQHDFDSIVRSVASEVIAKCNILGGVAILENAYEATADIVGVPANEIESTEPQLLRRVKEMMPRLPFEKAELLIVDRIGKDISGTGIDTNIVGRKKNDTAAVAGDSPSIHHIYVRGLSEATHGNASGIGIAALCHRRVVEQIDHDATRTNCITASHITGAMMPVDFPCDRDALEVAWKLAGWLKPDEIPVMWIHDTLSLIEVECSEAYYAMAQQRDDLQIIEPLRPLRFTADGDLIELF